VQNSSNAKLITESMTVNRLNKAAALPI